MENKIGALTAGLDEAQLRAVTSIEGPVLIVAGAGAGKTRVLTGRIAYALAKGCSPDRILALTFTKKAAAEMKERIGMMVGEKSARRLCMGTFHSVFIRFLREYADLLGYPSSFTIYDTSDSLSAVKRCIRELNLDDKTYKPKTVLSRISAAKNDLWTASAYRRNGEKAQEDIRSKMPRLGELYEAYQNAMVKAGVMDFDDILMNMNILLKNSPEALSSIAGRFDYILVDEYQDTNYSQYLILKKLSSLHRNICVVGDDSQSIYGFRGARIENILNFSRDYPDCRLFKLERNYRSTQVIVNAANSVIARNSGRIPKECYSDDASGEKIRLIKAYTDREEALLIASSIISRLSSDHARYEDFAILYRTNSQSKAIEEALRKRNLPYRVYAGHSFFDRAEIKDMMAYLKLVVNNRDDESFRRIVNTPARGIGDTTVEALARAAADASCSLFEAISLPNLPEYGLKSAALNRLIEFGNMVTRVSDRLQAQDAYVLATSISDACGLYASFKRESSVEAQSKAGNIEELMNSIKEFVESKANEYREDMLADSDLEDLDQIPDDSIPLVTLADFLEDVSLLSAVDVAEEEGEDVNNKVTLMTVHSSKGLEFPYIYVAGMEDGLFPSESLGLPSDIEEERRLFYVALTRAKRALCLSFCSSRMKNGQTRDFPVSRFVREIDPQYIANPLVPEPGQAGTSHAGTSRAASSYDRSPYRSQRPSGPSYRGYGASGPSSGMRSAGRPNPSGNSSGTGGSALPRPSRPVPAAQRTGDKDFVPVSVLSLKVGMRVEHNRFGFGVIKEISGSVTDLKARIDFDSYGEKILLLKYAKLRLA